MTGLKAGITADIIGYHYDDFTLGGVPIANARSYIAGLDLAFLF